MKLSRRQILALTAAAGLAGTLGVVGSWWNAKPDQAYHCLTIEEALFLDAVAEAAFPKGGDPDLGGGEAGVSWYVDALLLGMEEVQRNLLRLSLHAFDAETLPFHGARFRELPAATAQSVLRGWLNSEIPELRNAFSSVYLFVGMAYTSHPIISARLQPSFRCGFGA